MIEKLEILKYRKLKDITIEFSRNITVISGANGTCKTSLLHLISNSFQAVNKNCKWVKDKICLDIINKVNNAVNPKVESLTKGDKRYNDPAWGVKGSLFLIHYYKKLTLEFRRHNSKKNNRYAVKPFYRPGTKDSLPFLPVIYLGLSRLLPYGEFQNDEAIESIQKELPSEYQSEIINLYERLTRISILSLSAQKMGDVKTRSDFETQNEGIDSNTISAGEDNIFIILTALISLKYYFQSIRSTKPVESVLLIDELDATLHPSLQIKMQELFAEFSSNYKIQIFFTTHSLSLIESALSRKDKVTYFIDNIDYVSVMDNPDIYKIRMNLLEQTSNEIYLNKKIPVFTEDEEARTFLGILFEHFAERSPGIFPEVKECFHLVDVKIGANNLVNIFEDRYLIDSTMQSICILDGDHKNNANLNKYIISLPGDKSPEEMIFEYSIALHNTNDHFWNDPAVHRYGWYKSTFVSKIKPDIDKISTEIEKTKNEGKSIKGLSRELNKNAFKKHSQFFVMMFKHWVHNPVNKKQVDQFYNNLRIMFLKTAEFHAIDPHLWEEQCQQP
jgi:AAA15 family ATPase/GTPase